MPFRVSHNLENMKSTDGKPMSLHYSGSFGIHMDSDGSDYGKEQMSEVKFHSIHKDHRFLTEQGDGSYKIHEDYSKPIQFNAFKTHGLIHKDVIKNAIKIKPIDYANDPTKHILHNPNKVSAVFSITDLE